MQKRRYSPRKTFWTAALLAVVCGLLQAQPGFVKGVNLTNWFQADNARRIQFSRFTRKDFERIKSLGCDVIRLPINLHGMTSGSPDYDLDPLFLTFLDSAVTWSENNHISLILDNHTFDPAANTDPNIAPILVRVWTQLADHYKDRNDSLYYEVLNEPHGISDALWGSIQLSAINAIRTKDTKHYIVVGPADWNSYNKLSAIPVYSDTKLIYTFHFYDPFIFTHQGASWTDPSMVPLANVPFPYRAADMPPTPGPLVGTWIEDAINNYAAEGTVAYVKSLIDVAKNFKNSRHVPIYCGEFGVYNLNSKNIDRVGWYQAVRDYFQSLQIPWTTWDYQGGFGLFTKDSNELFDHDLNVPLLQALDMNVPPQSVFTMNPKTKGFILYDDFIGEGIFDDSYPGAGTLDFYAETSPKIGNRCIYWTDVPQYSTVAFDFRPDVDLSLLETNDHVLRFWVRGNTTSAQFDVRFIDTKTGVADHPWRMGKTIDNAIAPMDGDWHQVNLLLSSLEEKGSYDNGFFNPEGKFDWKAVDRFEIDAEYGSLDNIDLWFDDIRILGLDVPVTSVTPEAHTLNFRVYPNPMREQGFIQFSLAEEEPVSLSVYSLTGQKIKTIASKTFSAGEHTVTWDANEGSERPGVYLIQIQTRGRVEVRKMVK